VFLRLRGRFFSHKEALKLRWQSELKFGYIFLLIRKYGPFSKTKSSYLK
jgi:hypothetical protein